MIRNTLLIGALLFTFVVHSGSARAATVEEMLTQIQALMTQIETLKAQLQTVHGELRGVLKAGLKEGMSDEDIKKIQEILATDPSIYPEGKVTGYFGAMTKEALIRFQTRHGLSVTGELDEETRALLEKYLGETHGDRVPPGLLRAPGIIKKVELRYREECDNSGHGEDQFCQKLKLKYKDHDTNEEDDSDEDNTNDSSEDSYDVEVENENGKTNVKFTLNKKKYSLTITGVDAEVLLTTVAEKLDTSIEELDEMLVNELLTELDSEIQGNEDDEEDEDD